MILAFYSEESGVGKDTAADVAADYLVTGGLVVVRDAFAWDGKVVCADALGFEGTRAEKVAFIDRLKLHGSVAAPVRVPMAVTVGGDPVYQHPIREVDGRDFIIGLLGSPGKGNGIRGLDEGFWTRQVLRRADQLTRNEHGERPSRAWTNNWTVISDMRFHEEATAVLKAGGSIIEIVRPTGSLGKHNEQRIPRELIADCVVNDGTLGQLAERVVQAVRDIRMSRDPRLAPSRRPR